MGTRSVTMSTTEREVQSYPRGDVPGDDICCRLDCLARPRFFCGQLLTDQDLTALLRWTQDKLRLIRYRHGWGVVSGLHVRCDPEQDGHVIVEPGYAVSCCGDDIVVCEDARYDLSDACREEQDPCAELRLEESDDGENQPRVVDLYIHYKEEVADPQTAFGRSVCSQVSKCEYSRTVETFELRLQEATDESAPVEVEAYRWRNEYKGCLDVLKEFREAFPSLFYLEYEEQAQQVHREIKQDGDRIRRWLLHWIQNHPLHHFCDLCERLCKTDADQLTGQGMLAEILFYLMQNCRSAFLSPRPHACERDLGVPLARIWLQSTEDASGRLRCQVLMIDPYPPYRRPIGPTAWPAPLGKVNLGQVVWHRWEEACSILADLGVAVGHTVVVGAPGSVAALQMWTEKERIFVACKEPVVAYITNTALGRGAQRVIGFIGGELDMLEDLPGISKRGQEALYAAGYIRYADVAAMTPARLRALLPKSAVPLQDDALQRTIERAKEATEKESRR